MNSLVVVSAIRGSQYTYFGVPVMITVPFLSVIPWLKNSIILAMPKIRSFVLLFCLSSPFTQVFRLKLSGLGTTFLEAITGPMGPKLSKDLA